MHQSIAHFSMKHKKGKPSAIMDEMKKQKGKNLPVFAAILLEQRV
jgi:hypothetical protein